MFSVRWKPTVHTSPVSLSIMTHLRRHYRLYPRKSGDPYEEQEIPWRSSRKMSIRL